MAFDVNGAKAAGYSDTEIADHLAGTANFDAAGARKAGYSDAELIAHLVPAKASAAPPTSAGAVDEFGRNIGSVKFPTGQTQIGADFAAAGQGAVSGAGEAIAGIGRQLPEAPGARTIQQQIAVMDAIDAKRPVPQDQDVIGYQFFTPEQKAKAREDFTAAGVKADAEAEKREPNALIRAGTAMQEAAPGIFPVDPALEGRGTRVGRMVGGMVPALGASAVGALGGPVGAVMAGAAAIGAQTYDGTYQEAISKGSTPAEAESAAGKAAMAQMALTSVPISRVLPLIPVPLREGFMKTVANVGANFIQRGGEMSAGNTLASIAQNYIRSQTTDPGAPVFEGMGDTALDSFLAGLVVHGATSGAGAAVRGVRDIATAKDVDGAIAAAGSAVKDEPAPGSWGEIFPKGEEIPTITVTPQGASGPLQPAGAMVTPQSAGAAASRQGTPSGAFGRTAREITGQHADMELADLLRTPQKGDARDIIPGARQTKAEIELEPSVSRTSKGYRQEFREGYNDLEKDNNEIYHKWIDDVSPSGEQVGTMRDVREANWKANEKTAFGPNRNGEPASTAPIVQHIVNVLDDPIEAYNSGLKAAFRPILRELVDADGAPVELGIKRMYGLRQEMRRQTTAMAADPKLAHMRDQMGSLMAVTDAVIADKSPAYQAMLDDYSARSRQIDAATRLQDMALKVATGPDRMITF
ncbi:MAG TPA: hypothetical protein VFA14_02920, partial [Herbaspirillum sp.]|nr:hypothetical protein [Herbaspirillum sp.]